MKHIVKSIFALFVLAAVFSCQKEDNPGSGVNVEEQYAYMDQAGEEALSQIEPADFQKLSDMMKSLSGISEEIEFDDASKLKLSTLVAKLVKLKGLVLDTDKITGTFTIDGSKGTYKLEPTNALKLVFKASGNSYTASFDFTKGTKEVKIGNFKVEEKDTDVYLIVPSAVEVSVSDNSGVYFGGKAKNIDCSKMPADWSEILDNPSGNIDKLNFSLSGSGYFNGKNSYRAEWSKFSVSNCVVEGDGTVYGNKGAFLASGKGSVKFSASQEGFDIDPTTMSFAGNIVNKITTNLGSDGNINICLNGSTTPQMVVGFSTGKVTFEDGSTKNADEVFNEKNFPKTSKSATEKITEFEEIFGWLIESMVVEPSYTE